GGLVVVASVAPCLGGRGSVIYVNGEPDDPVHPGAATYTFPATEVATTCGGSEGGGVLGFGCPEVIPPHSPALFGSFAAADRRPLTPGVYEGAVSYPANNDHEALITVGALDAYGAECESGALGRFQIESIERKADGYPRSFLVSFEQRCVLHTGWLRGCVRF